MKGFWSDDRPRAGQADARLLAAEKMHELRHTPYPELLGKAGAPAEVEVVNGPDGGRFRRRTRIKRFTRQDRRSSRSPCASIAGRCSAG